MSDPIADQSRSILDGHIVLSRELTDFGIYPPIHILNSASRVMNDIITPEHFEAARKFRKLYTLLKENEMLIRIGAYTKGTDPELDEAIEKKAKMERYMSQGATYQLSFKESSEGLIEIMK
jgi:flagellum-specific ATP synthase